MVDAFTATNAASSGIILDRKTIKALCKRNDRAGLEFLAKWVACLLATGYLVHLGRFDIRSDKALSAPVCVDLKTWPVKREGDDIYINIATG